MKKATAEQLAEIQALQAFIKKLAKKSTRTYSMMIRWNLPTLLEFFQLDVFQTLDLSFLKQKLTPAEVINFNTVFLEVIADMLAQYFIVDPLVDRFFPYGEWQKNPSQIAFSDNLTNTEATQLLNDLRKYESVLYKKAYNDVLSVYFFNIVFLLLLTIFYSDERVSAYYFVMLFNASATIIENLARDLSDFFYKKSLQHQIEIQKTLLRTIAKEVGALVLQINFHNPELSYFTLMFSTSELAAIFEDCCLSHQITITSKTENSVNLPIQTAFNKKKASAIKNSFLHRIDKETKEKFSPESDPVASTANQPVKRSHTKHDEKIDTSWLFWPSQTRNQDAADSQQEQTAKTWQKQSETEGACVKNLSL